jgi:small subunit ribosomal protein S20
MPNHKSCEKRLRQNEKRQQRNNYVRSTLRTLAKKLNTNISLEDKTKFVDTIYSQLDKAAKKGVIHPRTASRRKSRIALFVNAEIAKQSESA